MFSDPNKNIEQLGINPGDVVADFGSGSGHYSLSLLKHVGQNGRVYAIDIQKDLLVRLKNDANKYGFSNIEIIWGDIEKKGGTKLRDDSVGVVIFSNILFQLPDKKSAILEAKRILKSKGRVLVVDWEDSFGGLGPHTEDVVIKEQAKKLFTENGFVLEKEIEAGKHHYGLVFKNDKTSPVATLATS